jgi:NarL family two-component system response regulator LiaR
MTKKQIKVLIVDDHLMVRKGLALLVSGFKDLQMVGEASNAESAIKLFESGKPDVVLMDMVMPDVSGAEAIRRIKQIHAGAIIIALTSFGEEELIKEALRAGARGFLYKNVSVNELADAIRQAHKGRVVLDPKASEVMLRIVSESNSAPIKSELSEREHEVLQLLAQGLTNKQIALRLGIQLSTAKQYVSNIFAKLEVKSRAEAATTALRLGLIKQ